MELIGQHAEDLLLQKVSTQKWADTPFYFLSAFMGHHSFGSSLDVFSALLQLSDILADGGILGQASTSIA